MDQPALSTIKGRPIAKIVNNKKYKQVNIINPDDEEFANASWKGTEMDVYDMFNMDNMVKLVKSTHGKKLKEEALPDRVVEYINTRRPKEFHINEGSLQPFPNLSLNRDMLLVSGPSNSGKSYFIGMYLRNAIKCFPDKPIYMFSKLDSDATLEDIKITYIECNLKNIILEPIKVDDLKDSIVIFDDIDTISDRRIKENVQGLRDDCLEIGRHYNITTLCSSHLLLNYAKTKTIINESHMVTIYPRSGLKTQIQRFLRDYCGFDSELIKRIFTLPSRWVAIHKMYPMYIMYEKGVILV